MESTTLDIIKSLDWRLKAAAALITIVVSLFARVLFPQVRLWWKLRPYPVINTGLGPKAQAEFIHDANKIIQGGAEKVSW